MIGNFVALSDFLSDPIIVVVEHLLSKLSNWGLISYLSMSYPFKLSDLNFQIFVPCISKTPWPDTNVNPWLIWGSSELILSGRVVFELIYF